MPGFLNLRVKFPFLSTPLSKKIFRQKENFVTGENLATMPLTRYIICCRRCVIYDVNWLLIDCVLFIFVLELSVDCFYFEIQYSFRFSDRLMNDLNWIFITWLVSEFVCDVCCIISCLFGGLITQLIYCHTDRTLNVLVKAWLLSVVCMPHTSPLGITFLEQQLRIFKL